MGLSQRAWQADYDELADLGAGSVPTPKPLVLDLDGTLLVGDLLHEAAMLFVRQNPLHLFLLLRWLLGGVAHLKQQLAERIVPAIGSAPANDALVAYARGAAEQGRPVVLATASNEIWAKAVAARFPFIGEVLASCPKRNLKGRAKARALAERFPLGYVYAGDAGADLALWRECGVAIFAGRDGDARRRLFASADIAREADFTRPRAGLDTWLQAMRVHQWAKNMLVFAPMLLAGRLFDPAIWAIALIGFLAMGLTASATYLLNDLLDIEDDRRHWQKRNRPIAAGLITLPAAVTAATAMLVIAFAGVTIAAGGQGAAMLGCYCLTTIAYSFGLKRVPLLDTVLLAGLFTLRLAFGAGLEQVVLSEWLAVFSMILFTSLALAKRVTELARHAKGAHAVAGAETKLGGRGYVVADLPIVIGLGTATAVSAPIIMVLYLINEAFAASVYHHPKLLWAAPILVALWLGRIWLLCGRGTLADDPVSFAVRDKASLAMGAAVASAFMIAMIP